MARTGSGVDELGLRDLCDYVEFSMLDGADEKARKATLRALSDATKKWDRWWVAKHPVPGTALAAAMGSRVRLLAAPGEDGMAVGHTATIGGE